MMRQRLENIRFIKDLSGPNPRQPSCAAMRMPPEFSVAVAAAVTGAASLAHQRLAELVTEGEKAQSLRSSEGLARTSQRILALPLGDDAYWIGKFYEALALNRRGKPAFSEANEILIAVADHGPELFRAKALVVIGSNLYDSGDNKTALEFYGEATKIARCCESCDIRLIRDIRTQIALIAYADGDQRRALSQLEAMEPLALRVGRGCPPLLLQHYNNLAVALAANGRLEEALYFSEPSAESPFSKAYPEWGRTRSDLLERKRTRSGSVVSMSSRLSTAAQSARSHPEALHGHPAAPAATTPVGETRRHVHSPAALNRAHVATGILPARLALHRNLFARHLSFSPTPNTEARPLTAVRLDPQPVRERRVTKAARTRRTTNLEIEPVRRVWSCRTRGPPRLDGRASNFRELSISVHRRGRGSLWCVQRRIRRPSAKPLLLQTGHCALAHARAVRPHSTRGPPLSCSHTLTSDPAVSSSSKSVEGAPARGPPLSSSSSLAFTRVPRDLGPGSLCPKKLSSAELGDPTDPLTKFTEER
jgi:hypothetical protein